MTWSRLTLATAAATSTVLALGTLAACGGDDGRSGGGKTLEVWSRGGPEAVPTYKAIFKGFTAKTGIKVQFKAVAEFDTQLQARVAQKDLPDLFINDAGSLGQYQSQGLLKKVDPDEIDPDGVISDDTWDQDKGVDGDYYGVPFSRQANVLVIRKDWREKVGLPVPRTWDDLSALAQAFATKDPDGDGKKDTYGMVVPGTAEDGYIARWGVPFIWQAGGDLLKEGDGTYESVVDSPGTAKGLQFVQDMFCTKGTVVPGSVNNNTAESPYFVDGTAGMYLTGAYQLNLFDSKVGKKNVEVVALPQGPSSRTSFAEGEDIYLGASSKLDEQQVALAKYMITKKAQITGMDSPAQGGDRPHNSVVRLPVNTGVDSADVYQDPRWQVVADAYEKDSKHFPWNINFIPFRQVLADGMNAVAADCGKDVEQELTKIDDGFRDELDNQDLTK